MSLDIVFNRVDRVYQPGDKVTGAVVVTSDSAMSHSGIKLMVDGQVSLQLSARAVGLFEAFSSPLKPVPLVHTEIEISPGGKFPRGTTELPFEFVLKPLQHQQLFDTYHGVYVNVQYMVVVDMVRGMMVKSLHAQREFFVELPPNVEAAQAEAKAKPFKFSVTPESLQNVKESSKKKLPDFLFEGVLDHTNCNVNQPLTGELTITRCVSEIKSIELQLVRVEACSHLEGEAREATEVQNIQIGDGNLHLVRGLPIPMHMVFPRLFTCSTTLAKPFKIEFEVNLIVLFADAHVVTQNFPIKLYR